MGGQEYEGRVFTNPESEEHPIYPHIAYGFSIEELNGTRTDIQNVRVTVETDLLLDTSRINELGWKPQISLREGLETTYAWYLNTYA